MAKSFSVTILGNNSALPTSGRYPTAQVLNVSEHFFLIDCGEGTQMQLRRHKIKFAKINDIFISHLHGDHCFGLIGLISTYGLLGRKNDLNIYAYADLELILKPQLEFFCRDLPFKVNFKSFQTKESELIYYDKHVTVKTIPLKHRVPTVGFLFQETIQERKLNKDFVFVHQPSIKEMIAIKKGKDFIDGIGEIYKNADITTDPPTPRSYAFCTDTKYIEKLSDILYGVDLLYHESTFTKENVKLAKKTYHSTAEQAALLAKLSNAGKLLLGHFSSRYKDLDPFLQEAKEVFPNSFLTKDGDVFNV